MAGGEEGQSRGRVSVGPIAEGLERQGNRSGRDSLSSGEPLVVLVKRRSMIGAITRDELVDRVDQRTESLLGGRLREWGWESKG